MGYYNISNISSCLDVSVTTEERVVKVIAYCVVILFSLLGNSLVVMVIIRDRGLKTNTNRFIVNMCLSDLFATICVLPISLMKLLSDHEEWLIPGVFGEFMCKFVPFVQDVSFAVSILSMTVIAFDRYLAIVFPYKFHFITTRICYIMITVIWAISLGMHCHYLITMVVVEMRCRQVWSYDIEKNAYIHIIYFSSAFSLLYVIPLLLIGFFYTCVVIELYCRSNTIEQSREQRRARNRENREVAVTLITVVVLFAASWAPQNTVVFLYYLKWSNDFSYPCYFREFKFIAVFLGNSNVAQNAFVYFTFNKRFKNGLKKLFGSKCELQAVMCPEGTNNHNATTTAGKTFIINNSVNEEAVRLTTAV